MSTPGIHTMSVGANLQDRGFRYIQRGNKFKWTHPAEIQAGDIDCTDMDEDTFFRQVMSSGAAHVPDEERT